MRLLGCPYLPAGALTRWSLEYDPEDQPSESFNLIIFSERLVRPVLVENGSELSSPPS